MAEERMLVSEFIKRWDEYSPHVRIHTYLDGDYVVIPDLSPLEQVMITASPVDLSRRELPAALRRVLRTSHDLLHPFLMELPAEGEPYPYLTIDDLTGHYHRWDNPDHARAWLGELADLDYVLLDVETTGSLRYSQVIEVAVLDKCGDLLFHSLFRPTTSIDPLASAIHGMSWKDVKDAPTFDLRATDLYECLRGRVVLAYNAAFDIRLLFQTARAFQVPFPRLETACLMRCYGKMCGERMANGQYRCFQLGVACLRLGIPVPTKEFFGEQIVLIDHRAEGDARYLHQFAQRLIEQTRNKHGQ